jgi:MOSC domain-containing protein YiiM
VNLDGDDQADRRAHGGPDKAIYAYAIEDHRWWETDLERGIDSAAFGENLTTEGIELTTAVVGERWYIGSTVFEVSEPRLPCWRLNLRMDDPHFVQRFAAAGRPGAYLRIIEEGDIGVGDRVEIVSQPDHGLTVGEVARIFHDDRSAAGQLLTIDDLSDAWRSWAQRTIDRHTTPNEPCPGCD